ncbi:hypothetical protein [Infirmifilum sp.]|uniref:hypothetical protein n=1 Tax=Infirmifilum sp. TaxID=2856575 RepID=UPI003D0F7EE5
MNDKVSKLLEEVIRNEMIDDALSDALSELSGGEDYVLDFEPVEPKEGLVSKLVGILRSKGVGGIIRSS